MKNYSFLIFFGVILSIHLLVNYFIYARGMAGFEAIPRFQIVFKWTILFLTIAYPLGRFLEHVWYNPMSHILHWAGAFWFAGMLYTLLLILVVDLFRGANHFIHFTPQNWSYTTTKLYVTLGVLSTVILIVLGGHINAWQTKITKSTIHIHKNGGTLKTLKIVAASDIHLGTIIGPRKTAKLVQTINSLSPDIVLFAGDVVDEDIGPVIAQDLGRNLLNIHSKYGVYGIMGNHEYIGGADNATTYLQAHGVNELRDSAVLIDNSFYVVGREDKDKERFTHIGRASIDSLTTQLDKQKPIILLDHQPFNLQNAVKAGVDLQISGHTHHGQLWPIGYITSMIFEVSRGYKQIENSHFWVSTGFGTWGPPVRTGNRPEILEITLIFD